MAKRHDRPNVLFIMSDQHRFDYLGCADAAFLNTPNLDRLAGSGLRFTTCITNAPVCAPARIGLAAGLQPTRLGSLGNESFLPASTRTYYQRLRDAGYRVGCVGKLDLAKPDRYNGRDGDRPCLFAWGFTHPMECEGKMHAGSSPEPLGPYGLYLQRKGLYETFHKDYRARAKTGWVKNASHDSLLPTEDFEDSYVGRNAAQWIENIPDDFPWHLFVSFVGPHDPFDPPAEFAERYRDVEVPQAVPAETDGKPRWLRRRVLDIEPPEVAVTRRQYCGAVELIDHQIGQILSALEKRGMADNTYVIYSSDHGEMLGDLGIYKKSVAYEPALRVPLLIAGPGIESGVSDALVELIDLNPTICELAGLPPQENIDAISVVPLLRGTATEHRTETISALHNFRCIRTERFKFIDNYNDVHELYDLVEDPHELRNIAADKPDVVKDLRGRMNERFMEGKWRR